MPLTVSVSTMIRFLLNCSCTRMTFSVPLTTKYPPGSRGHSIMRASWSSVRPVRTHLLLRNIMGNRPRQTFLCTMFFPRVYWIVTMIGAAYVMSRNLHSLGVTRLSIAESSSRSGKPTLMSVYLSQNRGSTSDVTLLLALTMFFMSVSTK